MSDLLAARPLTRVLTFGSDVDPSELHASLAAEGRFDVIVVDSSSDGPALSRFSDVFFHLKSGGALFLRFPPRPRKLDLEQTAEQRWGALADFVEHLGGHPAGSDPTGRRGRPGPRGRALEDRRQLAQAVGRLVVGQQHLMVVNRRPALAKMREHEMDQVLALRSGAAGRVLTRLPEGQLKTRCVWRESSENPVGLMPATFATPPLVVREYAAVTCAPQQVAVQGTLLLPDTYRKNVGRRLLNSRTEETAERFARRIDRRRPRSLPGTYFYLDSEFPAHFGHAMTEQLSRLWAWPSAKQTYPDLKVLISRRGAGLSLASFERDLFGAAGIAEEDIVLVDAPVLVERLIAATPMFATPYYAHPGIEQVWADVGDVLVASAPDKDYPARVFCSRRTKRRRPCHNAPDVEALFASHGFTILHPEDLPFVEQARVFRDAEVVAGFAGSGLFSLVFSKTPKRVIVVSSESYTARNEYLMCSVLGHRLDVTWSQPDVDHPDAGWGREAFRSGFTFDFEREGLFLREVLQSLDSQP
ncbi:MAG TPA: glycosyltransferase 61 family protein [Nocardioidaceae bacterium]|nr:glycosyltransferase 61 family protein [Nocardioidaceae bacterium]